MLFGPSTERVRLPPVFPALEAKQYLMHLPFFV